MTFKHKLSKRLAMIYDPFRKTPFDLLVLLFVLLTIIAIPRSARSDADPSAIPSRRTVGAGLLVVSTLAWLAGGPEGLAVLSFILGTFRVVWYVAVLLLGPIVLERVRLPYGEQRERYRRLFGYVAIPQRVIPLYAAKRRVDSGLALEVFVGLVAWRFYAPLSSGR